MTKISQLSSIGDSLAIGDQFLIRDIDDAGSPNKSVTVSGITRALADGDATAPALAFAADKNTGIYRAGTDSLAVATNGTGRLYVGSTGSVGVGIAGPVTKLDIRDASEVGITIGTTSTPYGRFYTDGTITSLLGFNNSPLVFSTNSGTAFAERLRIDSSGRLLIGTSTALTGGDAQYSLLQVVGSQVANDYAIVVIGREQAATAITSGQNIGQISFTDNGGNEFGTIKCTADANAGSGDYPGRLVFSTTSDSASSPTERLRITSAGVLQIADAGNITVGTTTGTKIGTATTQKIGFYNATPVVQPAAVADATDAASGIARLNDLLARLRTLGIIAT